MNNIDKVDQKNKILNKIAQDKTKPLTSVEKLILFKSGWKFAHEEYIYVPDDWDGCMAYGIENIRGVLERIKAGKQHSAGGRPDIDSLNKPLEE